MGDVLAEIGKNLADRWLTLLVLPGALYLAVLGAAHAMGQGHAFDVPRVVHQVSLWATSSVAHSTAALVVVLVAIVLGSAAAGVMAQSVGSLIENVLLAASWRTWPAPLRRIASRRLRERQERWEEERHSYLRELNKASHARALSRIRNRGGTPQVPPIDLTAARERMTRISPEYPGRPTWIGNRIDAVTVRLNRDYDLDLATVWPSLWLVMPDEARTEVTTIRQSLTSAATLAGWGVLYLIPGALWWPGLLVSASVVLAGYRRARTAADTYALILEAAAHLYSSDLARQLGISHDGPLDRNTGWALTCHLQGRSEFIPLAAAPPPAPSPDPAEKVQGR